jgi:YD repeat-containing protein
MAGVVHFGKNSATPQRDLDPTAGRNSFGDLVRKTTQNGNYSCYEYDTLHRMVAVGNSINNAANPCKRFQYDNSQGGIQSSQ